VQSKRVYTIEREQQYHKAKAKNVIDRIINDKAMYWTVPRKEHIFLTWKKRLNNKMIATMRLRALIEKSYHALAFNGIRDVNWADIENTRKYFKMRKVIKIFYQRRYNFFFSRWKALYFEKTVEKTR